MSGMTEWKNGEPLLTNGLRSFENTLVTSSPALGAAEPLARIDPFGEGCLSGASSRAILIRDRGGGTRRDAHGQKWFWFILPKQKGLVVPGRNPALINQTQKKLDSRDQADTIFSCHHPNIGLQNRSFFQKRSETNIVE